MVSQRGICNERVSLIRGVNILQGKLRENSDKNSKLLTASQNVIYNVFYIHTKATKGVDYQFKI